jgi:hypothetical protein
MGPTTAGMSPNPPDLTICEPNMVRTFQWLHDRIFVLHMYSDALDLKVTCCWVQPTSNIAGPRTCLSLSRLGWDLGKLPSSEKSTTNDARAVATSNSVIAFQSTQILRAGIGTTTHLLIGRECLILPTPWLRESEASDFGCNYITNENRFGIALALCIASHCRKLEFSALVTSISGSLDRTQGRQNLHTPHGTVPLSCTRN